MFLRAGETHLFASLQIVAVALPFATLALAFPLIGVVRRCIRIVGGCTILRR